MRVIIDEYKQKVNVIWCRGCLLNLRIRSRILKYVIVERKGEQVQRTMEVLKCFILDNQEL